MPRASVINPYQKFYALDGITPLSGGSVRFYTNLTTTYASIYSDRNLTVPQSNPYTLDAGGAIAGDVFFDSTLTLVTYTSVPAEVDTFNYVTCFDQSAPFILWDNATTYTADYSSGNIVRSPIDSNYYISIQGNNLNHEPSVSPTWWTPYFNYLAKIQSLAAAKEVVIGHATTGLDGVAITAGYTVIGDGTTGVAGINTKTKGTIAVGNGTTTTTLAVGTDGYPLVADSASAAGVKYSAAATSGCVLLATLTPTAAANVDFLSTFTSSYDQYMVVIDGVKPASDDSLRFRLATAGAADTGSNYVNGTSWQAGSSTNTTATNITVNGGNVTSAGRGASIVIFVLNANDATNLKTVSFYGVAQTGATPDFYNFALQTAYFASNTVSGGRLYWSGGANFSATGKVRVYGFLN